MPKAGERAPSDEVTNGGGDDGGGGDGGAFRFDGNDGGAGGAGADGATPAPTWTDLYSRYFGPNTPGHCGRCHRNGCELNKNACYQWFARKKQFPLQTSRLTWFGGDMPKDNLAPNPQAELDMTAWQTSGGENN